MTKWAALSDRVGDSDQRRFEALQTALVNAGAEVEFTLVKTSEETFADDFENAKHEFGQLRLGGQTGEWALPHVTRLPSALLSLKASDALVCDNNEWWPRFYLVEGLNRTLATTASTLDFSGSVLIVGATTDARAAVAALSRIGFNRMIISDPSRETSTAFVEELKRAYFGIQFQAVDREAVTQIPGVCSIAVNTLSALEDATSILDLAYFNFLKPDGFWLDLAIYPFNASLQSEAKSVGAALVSGARVYANTDSLWAETVFKKKIDIEAYTSSLSSL